MTTKLTIKDLNCGNCGKCEKNPNDDYFCAVTNTEIDFTDFESTELRGCCLHPLALQVLAGPVIEELERRNARSKKMNVGMLCTGVREGREEAIKLLNGGVKEP